MFELSNKGIFDLELELILDSSGKKDDKKFRITLKGDPASCSSQTVSSS